MSTAAADGEPQCTLCQLAVAASDAVWQCPACYVAQHLPCVQRHAARALSGGAGLAAALLAPAGAGAPGWACAHCRAPLAREAYPSRSRCWCGATTEPERGAAKEISQRNI